MDYVACC